MAEPEHTIRRAALLGAGVIGGGWAARLVLAGVDVRIFDPSPHAERAVRTQIAGARRAWQRLILAPMPPEGTLTMVHTVAEAVAGAEFVQESAPEREDLKRALLAEASRAAAPEAIIATSTSGLLPSRLGADMDRPDRFLVGHPFNPVYLLPLVEVCGAGPTSGETLLRAAAIYRALGMRPLFVRHEIGAFIANRLLEALWREALWLVADDVATVGEVDDAIRYGPGLRWAAMGTFLTYRLAGGEAGMGHFLAQFGPTLELPWSRLTDVPTLDQLLIDKIVAQSDEQAQGLSTEELIQIRDDCLVSVLRGLKDERFGAGMVIAETERRLRVTETDWTMSDGWLTLHEATVLPEWIDYNGHMTECRYAQILSDVTDVFLGHIGIGASSAAAGRSYYTVETRVRYLAEAQEGERLRAATKLLSHDDNRLHLRHQIRRLHDDKLLATGEHVLLHIDTSTGQTAAADASVLLALAQISKRVTQTTGPATPVGGRPEANRQCGARTSSSSGSLACPPPPPFLSEAEDSAFQAFDDVSSNSSPSTDSYQYSIPEVS